MRFYSVNLPYANFGIFTGNDNRVINDMLPPIAKWMKGRHITYIQNWANLKGGDVIDCTVTATLPSERKR